MLRYAKLRYAKLRYAKPSYGINFNHVSGYTNQFNL